MTIETVTLTHARIPLVTPYKISQKTFTGFDPYIVEVTTSDGDSGFGEGHISPGYSFETQDGGWDYCRDFCARLPGMSLAEAHQAVMATTAEHPTASSAILGALEMAMGHPLLEIPEDTRIPLLDPIHAMDPDAIPAEVDELIAKGFKTLKVKVGFDVDDDLARVAVIQRAVRGRGVTLRLDANRNFEADQGCRFGAALDPENIMLFEQPCGSKDWKSNAMVAKSSNVPVMMDESIYGMDDIDRSAEIDGVGFVKLKLKKFSSLDTLKQGLDHIRALGLTPVLGDGTSTDIQCWMEACVARVAIDNAGENNGHLKLTQSLFENPMGFDNGDIVLPKGYTPRLDQDAIKAHRVKAERFTKAGRAAAE
jgi:L-alanine-DL-glutamate epimerase-like enolase superfamily enzyme